MVGNIDWPQKTRDIHNHHMNSTIWNDFKFRDDDIIIATWAKSGTTWMQQIIGQLIFNGDPSISSASLSPWLDIRVLDRDEVLGGLEAQTHRRFIKTHLPVDALVFSPRAKYIYLGRDFPDVVWSAFHHLRHCTDEFYEMINDTPGRVGPRLERPGDDVYAYWLELLRNDGQTLWPFWENIRSWWKVRNLPNVELVHFNQLKTDMPGEIKNIAEFLDISLGDLNWNDIVEHCTFHWMKQNADLVSPAGGAFWEGGGKTFINKGTNKRWKDVLSDDDIAEYKALAIKELGQECTTWLENGELGESN